MADRLIVIVWDLVYSLSEPDFRISFYESYHDSSNSPNVDISRNSNGHISVLRDVTVTWLGTLVVQVLCMLTRSKVKVKVTGLLNFRQLAKPCMLAAMFSMFKTAEVYLLTKHKYFHDNTF